MAKQTVSRYSGIKHVTDMRLSRIEINPSLEAIEYRSKEGEFLTDLAWRFLGDAQYYWVLADVNNIMNPFTAMLPGQVLLIPKSDVFAEIVNGKVPIR